MAEYRAERVAVVTAEVGDSLEVGFQVPQQPNHFNVAVSFGFQASAGPDPVEITVDVELQQITGRVARTASLLRSNPTEPCGSEIEPIDKRLDEPYWVLRANILVQRFRQQ